jgi:hypothetical protein
VDFTTTDFNLLTCGTPVDGNIYSFLDRESLSEIIPKDGEFKLDPDCGALPLRKPPSSVTMNAGDFARYVDRYRQPGNPLATHPMSSGCRLIVCLKRRPEVRSIKPSHRRHSRKLD